jgi:hypothetical protein
MTPARALASAICALIGLLPNLGQAAPAPANPTPDDGLIEELVVTARYPGPAFWWVSDADSEIWVLATPNLTPKGLVWDKRQLEKVIQGANAVILPSVVSVELREGIKFLISNRKQFNNPGGKTLAEVLPQSSIDNYLQIDTAYRKANALKSKRKPALFAFQLRMDMQDKKRWSDFYTDKDILALTRKYHVPVRRASVQRGIPIAEGIIGLGPEGQATCFDAIVTDLRHNLNHVDEVAKAWADGDTALMLSLASARNLRTCAATSAQGQSAEAKVYADELGAVKRALDQPGKTLVVVSDTRALVEKRGILAQLKAQGLTVRSPAE